MADSSDNLAPGAGAGQAGQPQAVGLRMLAQYVKDISFENPGAPNSLAHDPEPPKIEVNIDVGVRQMGDDRYEVTIRCNAAAQKNDAPVFVVDVEFAGLFQIQGAPQEALQPILLIECPRVIFPFLRRVVADLTRDGGFMPLLLDPIDFNGLYQQQMQARADAQRTAEAQGIDTDDQRPN